MNEQFILTKVNCDLINIYSRNCDVMFSDSNAKSLETHDIQYSDRGFFFGLFLAREIDFSTCETGSLNL